MPTLRRILKYTPAVVLGLLVVAWVISPFYGLIVVTNYGNTNWGVDLSESSVVVDWDGVRDSSHAFIPTRGDLLGSAPHPYLGQFSFYSSEYEPGVPLGDLAFPIPVLITAMLPLAIGPFLSFRFRLWHYLAYTALIALELAYYLRWQG